MNIVIAMDSFKGSLSSIEAGNVIKNTIEKVMPDADVRVCPLADGGEGTVEALTLGMGGALETITVTGSLGKPVQCVYGILADSQTAIIEMSGAAGITLVQSLWAQKVYRSFAPSPTLLSFQHSKRALFKSPVM